MHVLSDIGCFTGLAHLSLLGEPVPCDCDDLLTWPSAKVNTMKLTAHRSRHSETCFGAFLELGLASLVKRKSFLMEEMTVRKWSYICQILPVCQSIISVLQWLWSRRTMTTFWCLFLMLYHVIPLFPLTESLRIRFFSAVFPSQAASASVGLQIAASAKVCWIAWAATRNCWSSMRELHLDTKVFEMIPIDPWTWRHGDVRFCVFTSSAFQIIVINDIKWCHFGRKTGVAWILIHAQLKSTSTEFSKKWCFTEVGGPEHASFQVRGLGSFLHFLQCYYHCIHDRTTILMSLWCRTISQDRAFRLQQNHLWGHCGIRLFETRPGLFGCCLASRRDLRNGSPQADFHRW